MPFPSRCLPFLLLWLPALRANAQATGLRTPYTDFRVQVELPYVHADGSWSAIARRGNPSPVIWHHLVRADSAGRVTDSLYLPRLPNPALLVPDAAGDVDVIYASHVPVGAGLDVLDLLRLDPAGDTVWRRVFDTPPLPSGVLLSLQPDGAVYVTGRAGWPATSSDQVLIRIDTAGNEVDRAILPGFFLPRDAQATDDGGVLLLEERPDAGFATLVKLDAALAVQWVDTVTGFQRGRLVRLPAGGFALAGGYRGLDGTRNGYRVLRLDGNGSTIWSRYHDRPRAASWVHPQGRPDGGISLSCTFERVPGWGDHTAALVRLDPATGDTLTERYLLPGERTRIVAHRPLPEGGFVLLGWSYDSCITHPVTGDVVCFSGGNFWLLTDSLGRVGESRLQGTVFADRDADSLYGAGDDPLIERIVTWEDGFVQVLTDADGRYRLPVYAPDTAWLYTSAPPHFSPFAPAPSPRREVPMGALGPVADSLDFAFVDSVPVADLVATLHTGILRGGHPFNAFLSVRNAGTRVVDTVRLTYTFDSAFAWQAAAPVPDALAGRTATWTLTGLGIGENRTVQVGFVLTDTTAWWDGALYPHHLLAEPMAGDWAPLDNVDTLRSIPSSSWDPNDKLVMPSGEGPDHVVDPSTDWLYYTVRFQNTGNDTAFAVRIDDVVRPELELASFEMLGASHPYTVELVANDRLRWRFPGIRLPDSTSSLAGSQGFVAFRLRPKAGLPLGTRVENAASIYFDFNPAVVTNTAFVTLDRPSVVATPAAWPDLLLAPNPASTAVRVDWRGAPPAAGTALRVGLHDLTGRLRAQARGQLPLTLPVAGLAAGLYVVSVHDASGEPLGRARLLIR